MAKGSRGQRRNASQRYRSIPYLLPTCKKNICEDMCPKKCSEALDKREWKDVTCSVCMEYPHNAVLLLCSSHDKGCRPYMCGTSFRHSNCLDQYKKAYTNIISTNNQGALQDSNSLAGEKEVLKLACPLCRGQVKGWTVVEPARDYLNAKKRSCMQDNCLFSGNYKELRKHVRAEHPLARPRAVDPAHEQKWRWLEWERERDDVISTVTSTMPGAMVLGDYVIEGRQNGIDTDEDEEDASVDVDGADRNGRVQMSIEAMNLFLRLHSARQGNRNLDNLNLQFRPGSSQNGAQHSTSIGGMEFANEDARNSEVNHHDESLVNHLHHHGTGRVLLHRSGRRHRQREGHAAQGS
ncbi:uncharacterized protein LOC130958185 [Arachis stenosperma]|uniref:uncharacterized protein LOC130958185 n=1 Tax=Arachis stenosperma TaxID=217475 RepID=UPI0025AD159B|nr:uncharacterized protein LOC130958185 [Arachis stenosperma]XP_057741133.1 uncharacterized protein LOC130958185 [Arachis stenosperma]